MTNRKHASLLNWEAVKEAAVRYFCMVLLVLVFFAIILLINGANPLRSFGDILSYTLGSGYGFSEVLVSMIPMLLTALAVAIPWSVGLINVGGEGQLYIGAAFATWGALTFPTLPAYILLPLMALLGMVGALCGHSFQDTSGRSAW